MARRALWIFAGVLAALLGPAVSAQTVTTYVNAADGVINGSTTCAAPLVRNFNVTGSFTVADVDLGAFATHTWRGDIRITLQAPDGTRVQLVDGDADATSGDNFNVRLDDGGTQPVNSDPATGNHSTAAPPPFQNRFRPNNALTAFNGRNSAGTWRMEICDIFSGADNGQFLHAELYLTSAPTNFADLSLIKSVNNSSPASGTGVSYTLQLSNAAVSPLAASGIQIRDILPAGTNYVSHSGSGTYNQLTGIWQIASLAPGASVSLQINAVVTASAGATITNEAQVIAADQPDLDSTPGNDVVAEDDHDTAALTVSGTRVAGIPPALSCPAGSQLFDWDLVSWAAGSTANSYPFGTMGSIAFNITNPGQWLNNAAFGGQSPTVNPALTGGSPVAGQALIQLVNLASRDDDVITTITLPRSVMAAQFTIFDVDFGTNQFADRVAVTASYRGQPVLPQLTNGIANYVAGNAAFGDAASNSDAANGNVVVTFQQPIDRIVIAYGDHGQAPVNPGQQAIAIHDITFCRPTTSLSATKVSTVIADPVNGSTNPKAIPGAVIDYLISIGNTGQVEVDSGAVSIVDTVPAGSKLCLADLVSGAGPVLFSDGSPSSGLSYNFTALNNGTDDLAFSADGGVSFSYVPTADANGCDQNVTHFRVQPSGSFVDNTAISLRVRFMIL